MSKPMTQSSLWEAITKGESVGLSYKSYGSCRHWRQRVAVGRFWVTCSGLAAATDLTPYPDFGIYLSSMWMDKLGRSWTNGAYLKSLARARAYPALVVDWPDMGSMNVRELTWLVDTCLSKMRHGKQIDIGCYMGHGRTGTLLACLMARVEHVRATIAIFQVRFRYCKSAVENSVQQEAVGGYVKSLGRLIR